MVGEGRDELVERLLDLAARLELVRHLAVHVAAQTSHLQPTTDHTCTLSDPTRHVKACSGEANCHPPFTYLLTRSKCRFHIHKYGKMCRPLFHSHVGFNSVNDCRFERSKRWKRIF